MFKIEENNLWGKNRTNQRKEQFGEWNSNIEVQSFQNAWDFKYFLQLLQLKYNRYIDTGENKSN